MNDLIVRRLNEPLFLQRSNGKNPISISGEIVQYLIDYQLNGIRFLHEKLFFRQKFCILNDDSSLGKCFQTVSLLSGILPNLVQFTFIICTSKPRLYHWLYHLKNFTHIPATIVFAEKWETDIHTELFQDHCLAIIHIDDLDWLINHLEHFKQIDLLIFDESSSDGIAGNNIKKLKAKHFLLLQQINCVRRLLITPKDITLDLKHLYNFLKLCNIDPVANPNYTFNDFKQEYISDNYVKDRLKINGFCQKFRIRRNKYAIELNDIPLIDPLTFQMSYQNWKTKCGYFDIIEEKNDEENNKKVCEKDLKKSPNMLSSPLFKSNSNENLFDMNSQHISRTIENTLSDTIQIDSNETFLGSNNADQHHESQSILQQYSNKSLLDNSFKAQRIKYSSTPNNEINRESPRRKILSKRIKANSLKNRIFTQDIGTIISEDDEGVIIEADNRLSDPILISSSESKISIKPNRLIQNSPDIFADCDSDTTSLILPPNRSCIIISDKSIKDGTKPLCNFDKSPNVTINQFDITKNGIFSHRLQIKNDGDVTPIIISSESGDDNDKTLVPSQSPKKSSSFAGLHITRRTRYETLELIRQSVKCIEVPNVQAHSTKIEIEPTKQNLIQIDSEPKTLEQTPKKCKLISTKRPQSKRKRSPVTKYKANLMKSPPTNTTSKWLSKKSPSVREHEPGNPKAVLITTPNSKRKLMKRRLDLWFNDRSRSPTDSCSRKPDKKGDRKLLDFSKKFNSVFN